MNNDHTKSTLRADGIERERVKGRAFARGDLVRKRSGSSWEGRVCGEYSTTLTPEGYAVESNAHPGSVQIYPAVALELVARAQGVKVTVHVEGPTGESTTVIDGRMPPIDVCTDPDNCQRCKAAAWQKHKYEHAGLRIGA